MKYSTYAFVAGCVVSIFVHKVPSARADDAGLPDAASLGAAITDAELATQRGGHINVTNTNNLNAKLYDNSAVSNVTGNNVISDGAFAGISGYATVVQNSGNNVIIQNATILNLQTK